MNSKKAERLKNKLAKVLIEVSALYKEIGELPIKHTWVIDACNSVTFEGICYMFFEDDIELYDHDNIKWKGSKVFEEYIGHDIIDTCQYSDNVVKPILKYCEPHRKKVRGARKKLGDVLCEIDDQDEDWVIDKLHNKKFNVEEIIKAAFEDVTIEEDILYSCNKKTWVKSSNAEDFIESEGLVDGTAFWIKRDGNIKKYVVEEVIERRFFAKEA